MEGHVLRRAALGVSLWELSLGVALIAVMAGALVMSRMQMVHAARGERTLRDMSSILEACRQYDALNGGWPPSLSALRDMLPRLPAENIWGHPFVIAVTPDSCRVETDIPSGAAGRSLEGAEVVVSASAGMDCVRSSTVRMHGSASRLVYEKRNVYVR